MFTGLWSKLRKDYKRMLLFGKLRKCSNLGEFVRFFYLVFQSELIIIFMLILEFI